MARAHEIPRESLGWLLIAQVLVIAPMLLHLPLWIIGLWLLCAGWRVQVYRMRLNFPRSIVKLGMMVSTAFAVYWSRGSLVGLDAGVALLVTAFVLKLAEARSRRDALVLIYLGFFTLVASFLFDDGIVQAAYSLLPLLALLAALVALQGGDILAQKRRSLKTAALLVAQAIPLTLLLFVFFPRLDPLWMLPSPKDKGVTGLSTQMSPGDIAELSQSAELVFRARFDQQIPPKSQLYWRALSMSFFDGRSWHVQRQMDDLAEPQWRKQGEQASYSVVMEPSQQPWLFSLAVSEALQPDVRMMSDFRLQRMRPGNRSYLYEANYWPQALMQPGLNQSELRRYLQLPERGNRQARQWAQSLRAEYPDDQQLVAALLRHFNQEPFFYSLKPPLLGANSVDEFLFTTRTGFCEHYSSSMVYVLRAAGIPARVVAGYQGGEIHQAGNYVQVRQYDAHSWVEYWQPGRGWNMVDPTFQVAPNRIELGLQEALRATDEALDMGLLSPLNYRHIGWLNSLRLSWDELNYGWQVYVLGYQGQSQSDLLRNLLGTQNWKHIGLGLLAALALVFAMLALWLFKPWRNSLSHSQRLLRQLDRLLVKRQLQRAPGEGLRNLQQRVATQLQPEQNQALVAFIELYERQQYAGAAVEPRELDQAFSQLRRTF